MNNVTDEKIKKMFDKVVNLKIRDLINTDSTGNRWAMSLIALPTFDLKIDERNALNLTYIEVLNIYRNICEENFDGNLKYSRVIEAWEFKKNMIWILSNMIDYCAEACMPLRRLFMIDLSAFVDYLMKYIK